MQDVESDVRRLNSSMSKSGGGMSSFAGGSERGLKSLGKWGSSLQWTGRQLGYNFTLPILAAGAAATKFAMDQEKAMTRLRKVYGDASMDDQQRINETEALERAFVALSNRYGIAADEVANIGAEWAAAGASGRALAENVELTMKTMILGELDAAAATQALISTQAQYGLTASELTVVMEKLNAVENQTGATTGDLITAFQRTAGVARAAGVSVEELAGMIAALTPAAGTASQAGNALKTIIGRIMSPTGPATQLLEEMGIATAEAGWQSMTASQRIKELADQFPRLTDSQKNVVGVTLASMHQTNRFETVLSAINNELSYYQKGLDAASDSVKAHETAQRELDAVLDSSPHKMKQVGIIIQNSMIRVIQPLIPMIVGAAQAVGSLAQKFGDLNPNVQKLIVFGLLLLASLGLVARYVGAMATLVAVLGGAFGWLGGAVLGTARFFGLFRATATANMAATTAAAAATSTGTVAAMRARFLAGFPGLLGLWTGLKNGIIIRLVGLNIAVSTQIVRMRAFMFGQWMMMWTSMKTAMAVRITQMQAFLSATMVPSFIASMTNLRIALWARWSVTWSYMMAPITGFIARSRAALATHLAALRLWATAGGVMSVWSALWIRLQLVMGISLARMKSLMVAFKAWFVAQWAAFKALQIWSIMWVALIRVQQTMSAAMLAIQRAFSSGFLMAFVRLGAALPLIMLQAGLAIQRAWFAFSFAFNSAMVAAGRVWTVTMAAVGTAMSTVWSGIWFAMRTIYWNFVMGIRLLMIAAGGLWASAKAGALRLVQIVTANALMAMRLMWLSFVAFIRTPGLLLGAFKSMAGMVAAGMRGILTIMSTARIALMAIITSPWFWAVAAVVGVIYMFRDQIKQVWDRFVSYFSDANNGIKESFNALPNGVRDAFLKVVAFVKAAAMKVYEWMQYLNPFARHSPSLVDNVTAGMAVVRAQYGTLTQIAGPIGRAYTAIKNLNDASANLRKGAASIKLAQQIEELQKVAPRVVPSFIALSNVLTELEAKGEALEQVIQGQQQTVDIWKQALDDASDALSIQEDILDSLKDTAQGYRDEISDLQSAISDLASTPLQGIGAMEDKIFDNEMAQKRLRLEIMRMEEAGQSYEDVQSRIASLNGEIESLRGIQNDLRAGGADASILKFYDDQIDAIEAQKKSMSGQTAPIEEANKALAELERQAEIMDLTKSLEFDPLSRQIEKAASNMKELPFEEILSGIQRNQAAIGPLEAAWEQANAAVLAQEQAVKVAQAAHDEIQAGYDAEQKKLDVLKDAYGRVSSAIQDVNSALSDMKAATEAVSEDAAGNISPQLQNFRDAASGADFPDPGGTAGLGREGILGDQSADIDAFTAQIEEDMANSFGGLDMFGPFKDMWNNALTWIKDKVGPFFSGLGLDRLWSLATDGIDWGAPFDEIGEKLGNIDFDKIFGTIGDILAEVTETIVQFGENVWQWLGQPFQDTVGIIWDFIKQWWDFITGLFSGEGGGVFQGFLDAILAVWNFVGPILNWLAEGVLMFVSILWNAFNGVLGPALDMVFGFFSNLWNVIGGLFDMIAGLFTGDWGRLWEGFLDVLSGLGGMIWSVISGIPSMIWGAITGLIQGIIPVGWAILQGLWAGIQAGWSWLIGLIGDIFWGIVDWVKGLFGISSPSTVFAEIGSWLMEGLGAGISGAFNFVIGVFEVLWNVISTIFNVIVTIISTVVSAIVWYIGVWADIITWLWNNVLEPIFGFIGDIFSWIWNSIVKPIIDLIVWYVGVWAAIFTWLWNNAIKPIFGFIGDIFSWIWNSIIKPIIDLIVWYVGVWADIFEWLWENVLSPIFGFIGDAFGVIGDIFGWVWDNVLKPIFEGWATIFGWLWENILEPIFGYIGAGWDALVTGLKWVWDNVLKPVWDAVVAAAQWVWEKVTGFFDTMKTGIGNIFTGIRDFVMGIWNGFRDTIVGVAQTIWDWLVEKFEGAKDSIVGIFTSITETISSVWNGIVELLKTPVRAVLGFINDYIIGTINIVTEVFGLTIPDIPINFATGGIVPGGYSPGKDNTIAAVGSGEAIMRPEWTRVMGSDYVYAANRAARFGGTRGVKEFVAAGGVHYANGGIVGRDPNTGSTDIGGPFDWIGDAASAVGGALYDAGGAIVDFAGDVLGTVADAVGDAVSYIGDKIADLIAEGIAYALEKIVRPVLEWIADHVDMQFVRDFMVGTVDKWIEALRNWGGRAEESAEDPSVNLTAPGGPGHGLGGDWQSLFDAVKTAIPEARLNSGVRNTADAHGRGKAVDFGFGTGPGGQGSAGLASISKWLFDNWQSELYELIYTGIGDTSPDLKNSRPHTYNAATNAQHKNHVHAAVYDLGGALRSGEVALNMSGGTERVLSPRQTLAFDRLVDYLDLNGVPSVEALEGVIFKATQRAVAAETIGSGDTVINNTGDTHNTYNFYGDLEFPNITDGDDAEVFLNNLSDLAGGRR